MRNFKLVLFAVFFLVSASAVLCAGEPAEKNLAGMVDEDIFLYFEARDIDNFRESLVKLPLFDAEKARKLLEYVDTQTNQMTKEIGKEFKMEGTNILNAAKSIKNVSFCLKGLRMGRHGPEGVDFICVFEGDADLIADLVAKLPMVKETKQVGDAAILKIEFAEDMAFGFARLGARLYAGDFDSMVTAFGKQPAKPLSKNAGFLEAQGIMKNATFAVYLNIPKMILNIAGASEREMKNITAFFNLLELDTVKYAVCADDFKNSRGVIRVAGSSGVIWDLVNVPCDKSEALAFVPKTAAAYGRVSLGKSEDLINAWCQWAEANKDTPEGVTAELKDFTRDFTRHGGPGEYAPYQVRELAFFTDGANPQDAYVITRCENAECAKRLLDEKLGMKADVKEAADEKYETKITVEDYKGAKIYKAVLDHSSKGPDGTWKKLDCMWGANRYAALCGKTVIYISVSSSRDNGTIISNLKAAVDAGVSGNASAISENTAYGTFNIKKILPPDSDRMFRFPDNVPKLNEIFKDYPITVTVKKTGTSVTAEFNIPLTTFFMTSIIIPSSIAATRPPVRIEKRVIEEE
jgi:hypothetical protein